MIACATPNGPQNETLRNWFDRYYWPRKIRSLRTKALYIHTIELFGRWLGADAMLADLNDETCQGFISYRHETVSAHTAARDRCNLAAMGIVAAKKGYIPVYLDLPPVPVTYPTPTAHRPEQFERLMQACRETPGMIGNVLACDWWSALHAVMIYTGERTGATLAIQWEWLTPDGWLTIPARFRKGGKKAMTYRLPEAAMKLVAKLQCNGSEFIFAQPWSTSNGNGTFYNRYSALLNRAGLPTGRRFKPQMLRRTFASYLKLAGGNPTEAMAHDSPKVTKQSYLDPTVSDAVQPGDMIAKRFGVA
jgi:integrase